MQEIVCAIDIGTTKVCALMAEVSHDSLGKLSLRLLGEGQASSRGIRRGRRGQRARGHRSGGRSRRSL
jgi:cell division ATPase FtsA